MTTAIIVAAGKSARMGGDVDKAFLSLGPKPVLAYSLMTFEACPDIDKIVLVVRKDQLVAAKSAGDADRLKLYGRILYDQALLVEGSEIKDPADFVKKLNRLLTR